MISKGKHSFVSIIVGILILSTVLKNLKVARSLAMGVVAVLVIAGMAGSAGAAVSGLVAEWHFDGSAQDTSGSGNHGTINGATFVQGISGQALTFDGNDYVEISDSTSLDITSAITIEAWIYPKAVGDGNYHRIVDKYYSGTGYALRIEPNGRIAIDVNGWLGSDIAIPRNQWSYVVGVSDGTYSKIYLNGQLIKSGQIASPSGTIQTNNYPLRIGCLAGSITQCFNGIIDEVRIYNRALSASEIQAEYNALIYTPATATPNTVLLDDFNGATKGKGFGALTYEDSQPNLGKAVTLTKGTYIKYSFSPWYRWDGAHSWNRNEAASGVLTEGKIEMWIKPRQYSGILNFNWGDAASYPPAGHILNFGFNADGKLAYSVWGGNSDKGLVGKTTIPLNKWTRVAVSWSPNGTKLYVNGEVDASTSANVWPAFSGTVFAYLNYWGGNDLGVVDELHISKVAEPAPPTTSTITVTTNLAGASFTLTGASSYSGSGTSWSTANAPAGTYTITYGAVTGYNTPPSETKTLSAGGNIDFSGTYIPTPPTTGTISVTTNLAGATFSLKGASSYSGSGTSWSTANVPVGTYTITYGAVTGYNAPPSETKTLSAGGSIAFSGAYTPTSICKGPKEEFETALKNFRDAEDVLKDAEANFEPQREQFESKREAFDSWVQSLTKEEKKAKKEEIEKKKADLQKEGEKIKDLGQKLQKIVKEFLERKIDVLIADIELLKCDVKFAGNGEALPFDASDTLDKHIKELNEIRTSVQQASKKQDIKSIDQKLKEIKEKFELEKRYYKGIRVNNNMDDFFAITDDASARMNELIKKLDEQDKDTSKLTGILSDFNNLMNDAKDDNKKTLDLFREHSGFDSYGMVTDIRKAQDFVKQIKEQQKDTQRLRSAIAKMREFFEETNRLIKSTQESTAPATGGVKT